MQNIIEISLGNTFESEKNINFQKTILENEMDTEFNANEAPKIWNCSAKERHRKFLWTVESVEAKRNFKFVSPWKKFRILMYSAVQRF